MSSPTRPSAGELETLRARTLAELEHQLELQRIDPGEFERRTEQAIDAGSALELRPLVADLLTTGAARDPAGGRSGGSAEARHGAALEASPSHERMARPTLATRTSRRSNSSANRRTSAAMADHDWAVAFMSGSNRGGQWEPAEEVTAFALMGGVRLDFREAAFLEGVVTRVSAFCLMGGVEIIVPPDIHVSVAGTGLLGGFGHVSQTAHDAGAPRLHVTGLAVLGGVAIKVRDLGEDDSRD